MSKHSPHRGGVVRSGATLATRLAVVLIALSTWCLPSPSQAATLIFPDPFYRLDRFAWFPDVQCNAELSGKINVGDAEEMKAKLEAFGKHPAVGGPTSGSMNSFTLCLNSLGGDLPEAIKIAELFRGWNTVVPAHAKCLSACAVIFMHALNGLTLLDLPTYIDTSRRYLHPTATLGFHAPDLSLPRDGPATMTRADAVKMAGEMYRRALASVRALVAGTDAERDSVDRGMQARESGEKTFIGYGHFARARFPAELLLAILTTPHEDMYTITTVEEALSWGIDIYGLPPPRVLTGNMLLMACYNHLHVRCRQGSLNWQCPYESERFETHGTSSQDSLGSNWFKEAWEDDRITSRRLWPRRDQQNSVPDTAVQLFRLNQTSYDEKTKKRAPVEPALCAIEAVWRRDKLVGFEIQTMNGNSQQSIEPKYAMTPDRVMGVLKLRLDGQDAGIYPDQLRPWRMLPTGTKLKELAGPNPWGWLAEGGNFFDKAPGW